MAPPKDEKENTGAWIIHHGRKLALDANGSSEYPAIDEAAKAATLLAKLGEHSEATLSRIEVQAIAKASKLNPGYELNGLLKLLEGKRLIEQSDSEVVIVGVTTRAALGHAADIFKDADPGKHERAAIDIGDWASVEPLKQKDAEEQLGDKHKLASGEVKEFLGRAEQIGFVDAEGEAGSRLYFNGNLFRKDSVTKAARVLESLKTAESTKVVEIRELLERRGCVPFAEVEIILGTQLFEKLRAAGLYDINIVGNEAGEHSYVTAPSAFHKFVNPMVDDSFDMAKALVAALTYGINARATTYGRIMLPEILIGKLIRGGEVGPATAIGQDYRVLEMNRVVKLRQDAQFPNRFHMRLLKREIGELALQVLTTGDASAHALELPGAPMSSYVEPETARTTLRRAQTKPSKRQTQDVLNALRGGRF
jgi:hypothetical protein